MIPVLSTHQMRSIDGESIKGDPVVGYAYMVKAGRGVYEVIAGIPEDEIKGDIAVVCGKGNNGGDGYVVARLLCEAGLGGICYSLCDTRELRGEAALAHGEFVAAGGSVRVLGNAAMLSLEGVGLIVDAILGTGIKGNPRGLAAEVIHRINASGIRVVSVDTPSGLDNDTGIPANPCINAWLTVTMGFPKPGAYWYPGRSCTGRLVTCDLGYPQEIINRHRGKVSLCSMNDLRDLLPPRKPAGSKFDHGLVLMVAGSTGMTGSAALAAEAAMRSGCGMVHLAAPASTVAVLSQKLTETVIHPLSHTENGSISLSAADTVMELACRMQCLCIGPGLSREPQTAELVRRLVSSSRIPVVLDADGINAYRGHLSRLSERECGMILTPHRGEWARLFGSLPQAPGEVIEIIATIAAQYRMSVLLKGSPSLLAGPDGQVALLPYGNSALACAGTGDVLSGIIAGLVAQGSSPAQAGIVGSFLHGRAAEIASKRLSEYAVIARDVIDYLHCSIRELLDS